MIDHDEIYYQMSEFICNQGLWEKFCDKLRSMGYTDEEIEAMEDG